MDGTVAHAFLVGVDQRADLVMDENAPEVAVAECAADGPGLVVVDLAARRALLLAIGQDGAILFEQFPVLGAEVRDDLVEVSFYLLSLVVGHDAGPVTALGFAVIAFHVARIRSGEYDGIDKDRTDLDELLLCGHLTPLE
jgi:hypothetical protein